MSLTQKIIKDYLDSVNSKTLFERIASGVVYEGFEQARPIPLQSIVDREFGGKKRPCAEFLGISRQQLDRYLSANAYWYKGSIYRDVAKLTGFEYWPTWSL